MSLRTVTNISSGSDVFSSQKCLANPENNFRVYFENFLDAEIKRRNGPPTVLFSQAPVSSVQLCGHQKKITHTTMEPLSTSQCEVLGKSEVGPGMGF